ncbi:MULTISPECIES: PBP1A family penicillin-binding protein [unclassified Roseitalea]|uniref:transglycosylase domain-containing protein n=1 Tax=unclassified Roseitalea TaxID=2639107 RepID=UPI00273E3786|nr:MULTISPECIES: PBP1A family penicillin-binding protein [unclassified Roseitalea]
MFLRKKKKRRVEPRFGTTGKPDKTALAVTDADRAAPPPRRRGARSAARSSAASEKKGRGKRARPSRRAARGSRGLIGGLFYWSFIFSIWAGVAAAGVVAYYGAQMPSASTWAIPDRPPNVKIVSAGGTPFANRGATGGQAVGLHEMSPYIPQAVIAIEDRRFYSHFGVDPIGLARAMARNIAEWRLVQGGSTITQQLAKNLFLSPERTIGRKVQEVLLALWLEQKYSKEQILGMYLNRVYFGAGSYGVEAASRRYFSKSARDVSLPEAAILAGLLRAPSRLNPNRDPQRAEARAQIVLAAMREQGMVSDSEMAAALSRPPTRANAYWSGSHHYVADAVIEELPALIGQIDRDVIVDTTLDLALQQAGEAAIRDFIAQHGEEHNVGQGALVAIDPGGAIRAMIGGVDYASSQFDRAREARRQPGSAFKPFVYLAALEQGRMPHSVRNDAPITFGNWSPENYKGKYFGAVTLSTALARSLNSIAAQLIMETGAETVVETATRLGITSALKANASLSLGTSEVTLYELTSAYVPFANGGYRHVPHIIERVTTMDSEVLYERRPDPRRVVQADIAGMMNAMMTMTVREGTARAGRFGHPAAGKTGTTQNARDAWFVGYTAQLVAGVWFGNDDGAPMDGVTGGTLPVQAWRQFMTVAHEALPEAQLPGVTPILVVPKPRPDRMMVDLPPGPDATTTASTTNEPRPAADVGTTQAVRQRTVLDVILGR